MFAVFSGPNSNVHVAAVVKFATVSKAIQIAYTFYTFVHLNIPIQHFSGPPKKFATVFLF